MVWGVGVAAYAVAVFQRTSLGVAARPATARFGITATVLSTFAVAQLIVYAAMQIPVGVLATIAMWTVVLAWPGVVPLPIFVVLILVLAAYGTASAVGFDFARTFNPATRLGAATGIVNMGGFTASLVTIFAIGLILDARAPSGGYSLADFKVAFAFQYVLWAFGLVSLWGSRPLARAELARQGTTIDPLPQAIARHLHRHGSGSR